MAQANLRSVRKAFRVLSLFSLLILVQKGNAFEFKVGGSNGWAVPPDPNSNSHNQWAEKNRFNIGDSLLFVYAGDKDSVLSVTKEDYTNCDTENPLQKFTDGHTVFKFEHSGPYYFISGVKDNCLKNEKLVVVVMADRSKQAPPPSNETMAAPPPANDTVAAPPHSNDKVAAPPPSNDTVAAPPLSNDTVTAPPPLNETTAFPPPSPSAEVPPSPAPTTGELPSPPSGSEDMNPTAAPSQESSPPKKNGATSVLMSFIGSLGALAGSSFLLLF